jgi:hypothetical protein
LEGVRQRILEDSLPYDFARGTRGRRVTTRTYLDTERALLWIVDALLDAPAGRRERLAQDLALDLCAVTGRAQAAVVVVDPLAMAEQARMVVGGDIPLPNGALVDLVLPTEPSVCAVDRTHDRSLRALADAWHADHLLLAPVTFGHDLLAVAVAPVTALTTSDRRRVADLAERAAAGMMRVLLFGS